VFAFSLTAIHGIKQGGVVEQANGHAEQGRRI
jgi:hypothetical protein